MVAHKYVPINIWWPINLLHSMLKAHKHELLYKKKFGFRKEHSTSHNIFQFNDQ